MKGSVKGTLIASAVALAFLTSSPLLLAAEQEGKTEGKVKCLGANACAGQSACKTATSPGPGKNSCMGKGFILTSSEKECLQKGGKPEKSKM